MIKVCAKCKVSKPLPQFYKDSSRAGGHSYICRECDRIKGEIWRKANKVYKNRYWREHRKKNPAPAYQATRKWVKAHPEIIKIYKQTDKHRRRAAGKLTRNIIEEVYLRCKSICMSCGTNERLTLDHIKPIVLGGDNSMENLQILCASCNSKKGTKEIRYA